MDYYTYQKQFADNLNEFINQQQTSQSSVTITDETAPSPSEYINYQYDTTSNFDNQLDNTNASPSTDHKQIDTQTDYSYYDSDSCRQPSPHVYDLSHPSISSNTCNTKTDDELWIETWLSKIGTTLKNPKLAPLAPTNRIEIHSAKQSLNECFQLLDQLEQTKQYLEANVATISNEEWTSKTSEVFTAKENCLQVFEQFERPEVLNALRITIEKRRKKRLAQKRRKQNRANCIGEMMDDRRKLHKDIDRWLDSMKEEVERAKVDENMKKEADSVLAEVTKKKSDARKLLSLISSLVKLRNVREQTATQRGEIVSLEDSAAFKKATDRLEKIWNDALNVYSKEEQGLRVMLEETAVEDSNTARIAKERNITQEWETVLFGPKRIPSPAYWSLVAAEKDLETFIAIRKGWDLFLTRGDDEYGTSIPIGWVTPNSNPHKNWSKYLNAF